MANVNNIMNPLPIPPGQQPIAARGRRRYNCIFIIMNIVMVLTGILVFLLMQSQSRDKGIPFRFESLQCREVSEGTYYLILIGSFLVGLIVAELLCPEDALAFPQEVWKIMRRARFIMG